MKLYNILAQPSNELCARYKHAKDSKHHCRFLARIIGNLPDRDRAAGHALNAARTRHYLTEDFTLQSPSAKMGLKHAASFGLPNPSPHPHCSDGANRPRIA